MRSNKRVLSLILGVVLCGCDAPPLPEVPSSKVDIREVAKVSLGAKVYSANCAVCHGARLEGQPNWRDRLPNGRMPAPPHDEEGHTWHHTDEALFAMIKYGMARFAPPGYESDMPVFGEKLSDEEIWAVLSFIETHWKSKELLDARAEMIRNATRR